MRAARPATRWELRLLPDTSAGRWSLGVFGLAVAAFTFMALAVGTGQRGGETFSDSWLLAAPALLAGSGAVGSAAVGAYAIMRHHEHSLLVYLITAIGLLVVAFVIGEGFATH